ncbi:MAG: hypothetical protein KJZ87_19735, partial [Thermoguttaceae bacterium]|nr:hypothetical protein [Thermoguttaceae bacterium]
GGFSGPWGAVPSGTTENQHTTALCGVNGLTRRLAQVHKDQEGPWRAVCRVPGLGTARQSS